jgi:hypothetical protein
MPVSTSAAVCASVEASLKTGLLRNEMCLQVSGKSTAQISLVAIPGPGAFRKS